MYLFRDHEKVIKIQINERVRDYMLEYLAKREAATKKMPPKGCRWPLRDPKTVLISI